jgi:hypothetical protein
MIFLKMTSIDGVPLSGTSELVLFGCKGAGIRIETNMGRRDSALLFVYLPATAKISHP